MSKKKHVLPFWAIPAHWGLSGTVKEIAWAEYHLEGEELERRIASLTLAGSQLDRQMLDIDLKYNLIDRYEYGIKLLELDYSGDDLELKKLEYYRAHNRISENDYEKRVATLKNEGWVKIIHVDKNGSFEFDWNDRFIEELEESGFGPAPKQEMIVDQWFNEICKTITLETVQGDLGLIEDQVEERANAMVNVTPIDSKRKEVR